MRDTVCDVLVFLWDKLGSRKLAVIDQLSLPLLRLTDSGHGRTREFGSSTYFDLLRTEYADTRFSEHGRKCHHRCGDIYCCGAEREDRSAGRL